MMVQRITDLREQGKHKQAVELANKLVWEFLEKGDSSSLFETLSSRCLAWKHLHQLTGSEAYLILALADARSGLELLNVNLEKLKNRRHVAYFRLAEIAMFFKDYKSAIKHYRFALKFYCGSKAEQGDFRYHLGEALFRAGKRRLGKTALLKGLREIQIYRREVDPFLANVWESGAKMRLAELLWNSNRVLAKQYLDGAEVIIQSDEGLVMRKKQFGLLRRRLGI